MSSLANRPIRNRFAQERNGTLEMKTEATPVISTGYTRQETETLARQWTKAMWNSSLWKQVRWLGVPVLQWPTDLLVMQELIAAQRPTAIVETGLYLGGTSIFYASILELLGIRGRVISVDIPRSRGP